MDRSACLRKCLATEHAVKRVCLSPTKDVNPLIQL